MVGIPANASRLRSGISCSFAREEPRAGGSHRVFKIIFEDSVVWAARENIDPELWETDLKGIKKLQYIRQQRPSLQAPDIFVVEEDHIMYLDWVKGKPLSVWNLQIPRSNRHQFLDGFADFLLQLWTIEAPPEFVTDTRDSYAAWLTKSLDRGLRRTFNKTARWGNAVDYLIMRSMIPDYASKFDKYTEFGFSHGDMNAYNILRAENFELTGVIDWDWAFVAPPPAVVHHPWFLADVPGWNNDGVSSHDRFTQDRAYLENKIAEEKTREE
ncbi:Protein kinase-like domain protein [Akanthomyces lecanii RCEF 1005]|uniref:Protein kinase-like domain protein n=1 Tax=Akanthomyces lecanii RCEF 1005 TaxID=1081108 RepID=A0A168JDI3_CORDF|nr:Protein kinase-like domain protein [Akanthomyces lecanii RCEF 1005]